MGNNWFECKVAVEKDQLIGQDDNYSGTYLADALTCSEAERRVMEEVGLYCNGALTVNGIKYMKVNELFMSDDENADKWYKAKVMLITIDPKTEKEKKTATQMIIQASNFENALARLKEGMRGTMSDYEIAMIQETAILDVFPFSADHVPSSDDSDEVPEARAKQKLTVDFAAQDNDTDSSAEETDDANTEQPF